MQKPLLALTHWGYSEVLRRREGAHFFAYPILGTPVSTLFPSVPWIPLSCSLFPGHRTLMCFSPVCGDNSQVMLRRPKGSFWVMLVPQEVVLGIPKATLVMLRH